MSLRKVALNANFKFGDAMCSGCRSSGSAQILQMATCARCGRSNCAYCAVGRTSADKFGLCATCGEGKPPAEHPPNVTFVLVDE
jgi:hypothetical protein